MLPAGSVLLSSRAPIGLVAINKVAMATNQGFKSLVPDPALIDANYLAWWLQSHNRRLQAMGNGATFKELSKAVVSRIRIPLPPIADQQRIARLLDLAKGALRKRGQWFESLDLLPAALFREMFGSGDAVDGSWPVCPLSALVRGVQGGRSLAGVDEQDPNARYRVLRVSAVTSNRFRPDENRPVPNGYEPPPTHFVRDGDLLFSRANTSDLVGAVALVHDPPQNLLMPDKLWRFVWHDPDGVEPAFVWQLLQGPAARRALSRRATGTSGSMKNISAEKLLSIPVIRPPRADQAEFGERYREIQALRTKAQAHLAHLDALFLSLQQRAFAGEL